MPNREDETRLNINPHPKYRIKYPYPASLICPACDQISVYYSEDKAEYRCMNEKCQATGKTLEEIKEKKRLSDNQLNNLWK